MEGQCNAEVRSVLLDQQIWPWKPRNANEQSNKPHFHTLCETGKMVCDNRICHLKTKKGWALRETKHLSTSRCTTFVTRNMDVIYIFLYILYRENGAMGFKSHYSPASMLSSFLYNPLDYNMCICVPGCVVQYCTGVCTAGVLVSQ